MTTQLLDPPTDAATHPVVAFAERLDARLDGLASAPLRTMSPAEHRRALVVLAKARARFEALQLRLLAAADASGACTTTGAADAAGFLAVQTQQTRRQTKADLKLAGRLEQLPALAEGMAAGQVTPEQARAIVTALERLPATGAFAVSADQRDRAEAHLVRLAAVYDAQELAVLGRKLLEVVAPDLAEAYEGRRLEAEEAHAARRTTWSMREDDQGICHGRFRIPARHGQMLTKALWALTNPTRHETTDASPIDRDLPQPVRQGVAFTQLVEALDAHRLPTHGGVGATVVVTMTLEQLLDDLHGAGACTLDTGGSISAGEARRLACGAGIIPVVLGGRSVVLDAGTRRRFHSEQMRLALGLRDGGCTAEGCDVPPSMCHAHHDLPFSRGGPTAVGNGRLLCGHHHRRIHDPAYAHTTLPTGKITFHRRT